MHRVPSFSAVQSYARSLWPPDFKFHLSLLVHGDFAYMLQSAGAYLQCSFINTSELKNLRLAGWGGLVMYF